MAILSVGMSLSASFSSGTKLSFSPSHLVPGGNASRDVVLIVNVSKVQVEFETVFSGKMEELSVPSEHEDTGD